MSSARNIPTFSKQFPDEKSCEEFIIQTRWPRGICCPHCKNHKVYRLEAQKRFKCSNCRKQFNVRTGLILAESKVSLRLWLKAAWLMTTMNEAYSSTQLGISLGVTQKTAWLIAQKIKDAFTSGRSFGASDALRINLPYKKQGVIELKTQPLNTSFDGILRVIVNAPEDVPEKQKEKSLKEWTGKIHREDCHRFMQKLPSESVGVIVTSPPYNLKNSTGNGMKDGRGGKWSNASLINGYEDHDDCMPHDDYVSWQRACLSEMMRILRPDGAIFYNHKWRVQDGLLQDRSDIVSGFPVRQIIIWRRKGGINFNAGYFLPTYEVIYLIAKPDFKLAPKANAMGDVWEIPQARDNEHPAPFPIELAQRCIGATNNGVVFDPFMGSGTTALAAEILNREWIGAELSAKYCKMAENRLKRQKETKLA